MAKPKSCATKKVQRRCFYYLLKITTIAIIKANAIIVIPTKP